MKIITNNEQKTYNFAKNYAEKLRGGEIIGLIGELGAGKTVFAKGLAAGLGIKKTVTSPTFVLMKIYPVTSHKSIKQLVHVDSYRISSPEELINIGLEEYFNKKSTIVIIEWADKIKIVLPKITKYININNKGKNKRIINNNLQNYGF